MVIVRELSNQNPDRQNPAYCPVCFFFIKKMKNDFEIENNSFAKRHNNWLKRILISAFVLIAIAGLGTGVYFGIQKFQANRISIKSIKKAWSDYDYQKVYEQSFSFLQNAPYNNTVLTYYAYACFFLS